MKRSVFNNILLRVVLILLSVCVLSCTKEDRYVPEEEPVVIDNSFPFSITVGTGANTRAGVNSSGEYVFRDGDMLFVANSDQSIRGELTLTSTSDEGRKGTFSGAFNEEPSEGTTFYVTLVSGGNDKIHTLVGEAPYRYVAATRTYPTGVPATPGDPPVQGAIASSLEEAINWYSDFTGSFNYGETNSCNLSQGSTFIEFNIRYLDIYVDSKSFGEDAIIEFTNTNGESEITADHREGVVALTADEAGYAYSQCFVAFPGGTVLDGAEVTISSDDFPDMDFSIKGATLQKSKKYNVKRDVVDDFSIVTTTDNTTITFNSYYLRSGAGVQYQIAPSEDWLSYTEPLTGLAANVVVSFRAKRVDVGAGKGVYDNQTNTDAQGPTTWPKSAGRPIFTFSQPVKVYGDIMSLLCDANYNKTNYLNKHDFSGSFWNVTNMDIHEDRNLVLSAQDLTSGTNHYQNMFRQSSIVKGNHIVISAVTMGNYSCNSMFKQCYSMTSAPVLKSTTMAPYCYQSMFEKCRSLTEVPELKAKILDTSCYRQMFCGTGENMVLTSVPEDLLPATELEPDCYYQMFCNCKNLANAPKLPATSLAEKCYFQMFYGCKSLTSAPELPATILADVCYEGMFLDCTKLTSAPELPATTLAPYCYHNMFRGCIQLTVVPALPATTLADFCYRRMFEGCTKITTAPERLPATTLAQSCYVSMFKNCNKLKTAPELPATTLADSCYCEMFRLCKIITESPVLPAETLKNYCYDRMFYDCYVLKTVTCLATNPTDPNVKEPTISWLAGVIVTQGSNDHTFYVNENIFGQDLWERGDSGIPYDWIIEPYNPE
ncbi:MAG: hypothetical protein J5604_07220 [Bacteroidales bacterium]|nr:hypothetical protein [Bacteroidales bacterium]